MRKPPRLVLLHGVEPRPVEGVPYRFGGHDCRVVLYTEEEWAAIPHSLRSPSAVRHRGMIVDLVPEAVPGPSPAFGGRASG